jgi:hypothetical protein
VRRRLVILVVAILVVIGVITGATMFVDNMVKKRTSSHSFELDNMHRFLPEEIAIAFGRKALALEDADPAEWEPQEDGRTLDPDGRVDKYGARNLVNPKRVSILFRNKTNGHVRCVDVEIEEKRVVCAVTIPK